MNNVNGELIPLIRGGKTSRPEGGGRRGEEKKRRIRRKREGAS
jgi:hypothetical protein